MNSSFGLVKFLAHNSSSKLLILSLLTGIVNGIIAIFLIWNINSAITGDGDIFMFILLLLVSVVTHIVSSYTIANLAEHNLYDIRRSVVNTILLSEYRDFELYGAGRLYTSLTQDASILSSTASLVPHFISSFSIVLSCFIYIFVLSANIGTLLIISLILGISIYFFLQKPIYSYFDRIRNHQNNLYSYYNSLIYGNRELKHDNITSNKLTDTLFIKTLKNIKDIRLKSSILQSFAGAWGKLVMFLALGATVYAFPIINSSGDTPIEVIASIITVIIFSLGAIYSLVGIFPTLLKASVSYQRIQDIMLKSESSSEDLNLNQSDVIHYERIKYVYRNRADESLFSIGPISLSIKKGEVTLISGGNGSGKTTLLKLLTGIYKVDSGYVELGNTKLTPAMRSDFRKLFTVIWSDCFIFDQFYLDNENEEKFEYWISKLNIKEKVRLNKIDSSINHRELSSGQKKRLALAIALTKATDFIVLDEWAAEQSPDFKAIFYHEIVDLIKAQGLGVVIISHDSQYFGIADKIITLESGMITKNRVL